MSNEKPKVIIYKESLAQSLTSDLATFGLILLCIYASQGSAWWTFVTGCIFLLFVVVRAAALTKSDNVIRFASLSEMRQWLDKQEVEHEQREIAPESVAEIMSGFVIHWAGTGPIAPLCERTGAKVGSRHHHRPSRSLRPGSEAGGSGRSGQNYRKWNNERLQPDRCCHSPELGS